MRVKTTKNSHKLVAASMIRQVNISLIPLAQILANEEEELAYCPGLKENEEKFTER